MATLIADRFLVRTSLPVARVIALDLATGVRVRLRIDAAGSRAEQQEWSDACARQYAEGTLIDFGFMGTTQRFEARAHDDEASRPASVATTATVVDWLEHPRPSSSRTLQLAELPDARVLREHGFVPCDRALLDGSSFEADISAVLTSRSVVVLDRRGERSSAALAVLRLCRLGVREFGVLMRRASSQKVHVMKAAEGRAAYGRRSLVGDPRVTQITMEADQLIERGRHAAAERALRSAVAAFERRGDDRCAGHAGVTLGRLVLARGRAADASGLFSDAHDRFQRAHAAEDAIDATVYLGLAQTDLAQLTVAEQTCRAAYAAASTLGHPDAVLFSALALTRTLLWQKRHADARSILEAVSPAGDVEQCARYWCLAARLRVTAGAVADAWRLVERARPAASSLSPAIESIVREREAAVQGTLGDVDATRIHVVNGLSAARAAHLPLQTIKLRLTWVEALIRAERGAQARAAARHLGRIRSGAIPPLLQSRLDAVLSGVTRPPSVRESPARFHAATCAPVEHDVHDLDGLRELLASSHHPEDETAALTHAATAIRHHTHAIGVGIFGWHASATRLFASSGTCGDVLARRSIDIGQPIQPERASSSIEAAVPVQYLGRVIGALAMRWNVEGPERVERAMAFGSAAAAVCAPLVYVLIERQGTPTREEAAFDIVGVSPAIDVVRKAIARAANAPFTVLLEGESGSGKELVARAIHKAGCRRERRFSAFNCAAMPEDLVDAELFGHAKGAFTGAAGERLGLFESADGGTVFLDEVGELSARAQAKVLRVLQEGEVRRIGENFTRSFDARLVAATNRVLRAEVDAGRFRQDLLYRLDVIRIQVPPLRERIEDIPMLAERFWRESAARIGSKAVLGQGAVGALARYDWPGNVRELQNVLTALVVAVPPRGVVSASELPAAIARAAQLSPHESLESARLKFEERFVRAALARAAGHRGQTAAALGLSRQGLAKLMQRLHLDA
jgi:two-component system response regulator HydG